MTIITYVVRQPLNLESALAYNLGGISKLILLRLTS